MRSGVSPGSLVPKRAHKRRQVSGLVAALFERDGFGDRDGDPSTAYLLLLALGVAASLGLPLALWRVLLPTRFSWSLAIGVGVAAVGACLWILGIAVSG